MFHFTKEGRLKSDTLLYAFFLGLGILFLNFLLSNRLTIFFEELFENMSRVGKNVLDIAAPSVLCAVLSLPLFLLIRKKSIVLLGFWIAFVLAAVIVITVAASYDRETAGAMVPAFLGIFVVPAAAGAAAATLLYLRWRKKNPDPIAEEEREQSDQEEQTRE